MKNEHKVVATLDDNIVMGKITALIEAYKLQPVTDVGVTYSVDQDKASEVRAGRLSHEEKPHKLTFELRLQDDQVPENKITTGQFKKLMAALAAPISQEWPLPLRATYSIDADSASDLIKRITAARLAAASDVSSKPKEWAARA